MGKRRRKREELVSRIAVQRGFVSQEQVDQAFEDIKFRGSREMILAYLARNGLLDDGQVSEILMEANLTALACPECQKLYLVHSYDPTKIVKCRKCNIALVGGIKLSDGELSAEDVLEEDPLLGQTIARYRVVGVIGEGGMGTVYKAYDEVLKRNVAIKVMPRNSPTRTEVDFERFREEARNAASLHHPNIVTVYEVG